MTKAKVRRTRKHHVVVFLCFGIGVCGEFSFWYLFCLTLREFI